MRHFLCDEIPLGSLCLQTRLPPTPTSTSTPTIVIPEIVFHGSQEHGSTLLLEHLLQFPLPQTQRVSLQICLRPKDPSPNSAEDTVELLDEGGVVVPDSSLPLGERAGMAALYDDLYARVEEIIRQREVEVSPAQFTFKILLHSPTSPLVNLLYFPLEASAAVQRHLTSHSSHSFYAFILSSRSSIRAAKVTEVWARRVHEVSIPSSPESLCLTSASSPERMSASS